MAEEKELTRRELLSQAWDKADEEEEVATLEDKDNEPVVHGDGDVTIADPAEPGKDEELQGESGLRKPEKAKEVGKKPKKDEAGGKEALAAKADGDSVQGKAPVAETEIATVTDKAPQSWKPAVREHWNKLPPEVRAEVNRRELQIQQTITQTAQVRKFANDFANIVNPVAHLIRTQHSTPLAAVQNLMGTAARLMQGSPHQKAEVIAEIIGNYRVDYRILDDVLTAMVERNGGRVPENQHQQVEAPPQWAQPIFGFMQQVAQTRENHEQAMRQNADVEIAKFESQPFFEDVREDIADILELAVKRNITMTMQQAYEKAIQLNPELSKIVSQRKQAAANLTGNKNITRARRAASTVSGAPSGKSVGVKGDQKMSRREQLSEAWDDAS